MIEISILIHTYAVGSRSRPAWDSSVITAVRSEVALLDSSRTASETKGSGKKNTKIVDNKESLTEAEALMVCYIFVTFVLYEDHQKY